MADINITITIPDAYVQRLSDIIDYMWPGRTSQEPVPNKVNWLKQNIITNLKQHVLYAEQKQSGIAEIEII